MVFNLLDGRLICWRDGLVCVGLVWSAIWMALLVYDFVSWVDVLFSSALVSRSNGWLWAGWKVWSARWMGFLWFGLLINCTF
jgi:hypothetical protein